MSRTHEESITFIEQNNSDKVGINFRPGDSFRKLPIVVCMKYAHDYIHFLMSFWVRAFRISFKFASEYGGLRVILYAS